ncbi:unnamed protein product (macronuclear) [Paramecium tetraurelia]|uniref:Uncharacterized protein n=1 Tax=Paramecium tetraurelia TaxID=5888 RepID=A0CUJ9_PARTE|nr:uncharacterized protein GSPATT00010666001 [Paramecium tetraurelia]CAK74466.1 unnamed protein product [Paramecium tetraurelia]|eukprot:XP_001441863.1 hypothetical protein (macronuclear) [Paramecium tetraurelia strain d4-2]
MGLGLLGACPGPSIVDPDLHDLGERLTRYFLIQTNEIYYYIQLFGVLQFEGRSIDFQFTYQAFKIIFCFKNNEIFDDSYTYDLLFPSLSRAKAIFIEPFYS